MVWSHKDFKYPKQSWEESTHTQLEVSHTLISDYTQNYTNQNSKVLVQKQTHRSIKQNKEPWNKLIHILWINLWHKCQEYTKRKRQSPITGLEKEMANHSSVLAWRQENPREGGAWWTAVYEVVQSQTRLKRLSSSSSE